MTRRKQSTGKVESPKKIPVLIPHRPSTPELVPPWERASRSTVFAPEPHRSPGSRSRSNKSRGRIILTPKAADPSLLLDTDSEDSDAVKSESDDGVNLSRLLNSLPKLSSAEPPPIEPGTPTKVEQAGTRAQTPPLRKRFKDPALVQQSPTSAQIHPDPSPARSTAVPERPKNVTMSDRPGPRSWRVDLSQTGEEEYETHSPVEDADFEERLRELEGYLYQKQLNDEVLERTGSKWTSLAQIYAEAKATGEPPKLPDEGPPCWKCEKASTLKRAKNTNQNGNHGRSFYVCIKCPFAHRGRNTFVVFADLIGAGADRLCFCGEGSREGKTGMRALCGPGKKFWTCAEGRCGFTEWDD